MTEIDETDWAALEHAHGTAADVPALWRGLLSREDSEAWLELLDCVCHQGTVYAATAALTPLLIELAKSDHPASSEAMEILGGVVSAHGGPLATTALHASLLGGIRNPITGQPMPKRAGPAADDLAAERAWVEAMQDRVEADLPYWLSRLSSEDGETRVAAASILTGVRRHENAALARDAVRRAAEAATDEVERSQLEGLLEDAEGRDA